MSIFDDDLDRSALSDRDQMAWLQIRSRDNLKQILELLHQTGYMAMAQAAQIYGGSPANARREIRGRLIGTGLAGLAEIRGNGYLFIRPAGARVVTANPVAPGVVAIPEKTDRTLTIAFGRVEWWLRQQPEKGLKWIPGVYAPLHLDRLAATRAVSQGPIDVPGFWRAFTFRGGVYCPLVNWTSSRITVTYLVIDVGQSRSAYRELIIRLRQATSALHDEAETGVVIAAPSARRLDNLRSVLETLRLDPPVALDNTERGERILLLNFDLARYTTYGFHRDKKAGGTAHG